MASRGISTWSWYVPRYRLNRSAMAQAFRVNANRGTRSVASHDEDTSTMGVEAARLLGANAATVDALWFSTTHAPILDKGSASTMAAVLGLPSTIGAYDAGGSLRSAVGALRLALSTSDRSLVVTSDMRFGRPGSDDEISGGDGAAAFTVSEDPAFEVLDIVSESSPIMDRWRSEGDTGSKVWDDRWTAEEIAAAMKRVSLAVLERNSIQPADLTAIVPSSPSAKASASVVAGLGVLNKWSAEIDQFGYLGAADLGVRLAWTCENSQPGDLILVVSGADGADAILLRATDRVNDRRLGRALAPSSEEIDFSTYMMWRGLAVREMPKRPDPEAPSAPVASRNQEWKFAFDASMCSSCGTKQLPPQRVCIKCQSVDQFTLVPMRDCKSTIRTFTIDKLAYTLSPPVVVGVIDFDGGGRFRCELTEVEPDLVKVGDRMEMVYRLVSVAPNGVRNYFWKARPITEVTQ